MEIDWRTSIQNVNDLVWQPLPCRLSPREVAFLPWSAKETAKVASFSCPPFHFRSSWHALLLSDIGCLWCSNFYCEMHCPNSLISFVSVGISWIVHVHESSHCLMMNSCRSKPTTSCRKRRQSHCNYFLRKMRRKRSMAIVDGVSACLIAHVSFPFGHVAQTVFLPSPVFSQPFLPPFAASPALPGALRAFWPVVLDRTPYLPRACLV